MTREMTLSSTRQVPHVARSRSRRLALVLVTALLGVAASPVPSGAAGADRAVSLKDCLLSGVNFSAERDDLEKYVPKDYEIGTYGDAGVVAIWVFSCEGATNGDRNLGPADYSVVGVLLEDDTNLHDPTTWPNALAPTAAADQQWAANWPQYVVWAHSDNGGLTAALKGMGMPVTTVPDITFGEVYLVPPPVQERHELEPVDTCSRIGQAPGAAHSPPDDVRAPEPHKATEVSVPWGANDYGTSTALPLTPHNTVTHCHDQLLKHESGGRASTVHVSIPVARDHFCSHPQPGCGRAQAEAGSLVADLLGAPVRDDPVLAFDHERIPEVLIEAR